jgi:5-(carboxyamino)imidazole ribonucleotide synthase
VGVIGAGQLGQMMVPAAIGLGLELHFLSEDPSDPAAQWSPHHVLGSALSREAIAQLAAQTDVVTCEHELLDLTLLAELGDLSEGSTAVYPSATTLASVIDKTAMRAAVDAAGIPGPSWRVVQTSSDLDAVVAEWPDVVAKAARGGYDGRGLAFVRNGLITPEVRAWSEQIMTGPHPSVLLLEPLLDLEAELAVLVIRGIAGEVVVYDPVRTVQVDGQCRAVIVPHGLGAKVDAEARQIALAIAEQIDAVGVLAVEMFVVGGEVYVNELAARPHNSGHHTIDACVTSQFENHLRAVAGLPLGSSAATGPAAVMVNLIARDAESDPRARRDLGLGVDPRVRIHLYGKEPRPQRKVGHMTVVAADVEEASAVAWHAVRAMGCDDRELEVNRQVNG